MYTFSLLVLSFFLGLWIHPFVGLAAVVWYRLRTPSAPFGILPLSGFIFDVVYRSYWHVGIVYLPYYFLISFFVALIIVVIRKRINFYAT